MIINKFGGASLCNPESVTRMANICKTHVNNGIVVVSAMGKTTNLLEKIVNSYFNSTNTFELVQQFIDYHYSIIKPLFTENHVIIKLFDNLVAHLSNKLSTTPGLNYNFEYDQIVPYGELASSLIFSEYLKHTGINAIYVDIRPALRTNSCFREASIDWETAGPIIEKTFAQCNTNLCITQGFIGSDINNLSTTLGREGSDYTASALAYFLNADKVVVWKDVDGVMTCDPNWLPIAQKIERVSYHEAIELAFFGAKVIHPKTIKPLQNKSIPLQVRSFLNTENNGTTICDNQYYQLPPVYIQKTGQTLISITPVDYSFIIEQNISHIFGVLAKHRVKVNLMQNSAISFSVSAEGFEGSVMQAVDELKASYNVKYNANLELITIRHYINGAEQIVVNNNQIIVEQKSRSVARYLIKKANG